MEGIKGSSLVGEATTVGAAVITITTTVNTTTVNTTMDNMETVTTTMDNTTTATTTMVSAVDSQMEVMQRIKVNYMKTKCRYRNLH